MADGAALSAPDSRYALYEGLIALAWADHELHPEEREALNRIIDEHAGLSDDQRARLRLQVETRTSLDEVWPRITSAADRAQLIDLANVIFGTDGTYCDSERGVFDAAFSRHLSAVKATRVEADLRQYREDQIAANAAHATDLSAYRKRFSILELVRQRFQGR